MPDRADIEIHVGNFVRDTDGCILVGMQYAANGPAVLMSQAAMGMLLKMLPDEFDLTVIDA